MGMNISITEIPFNINSIIKVKLSLKGESILKDYHDATRQKIKDTTGHTLFPKFEVTVDEDGYHEMQMWSIFTIFGPHLNASLDVPFDTNVLLCAPTKSLEGMTIGGEVI